MNKQIYMIFYDRGNRAQDNGEHLCRWVMQNHPEVKTGYILSSVSSDWPRLKAEGFNRLTINKFGNNKIFISGNKCNKYNNISNSVKYNMVEYTYNKLIDLPNHKGKRGKIGIPMVLNMFENLPFWVAFFESLDFELAKKDVINFINKPDSLMFWNKNLFISTLDKLMG